MVHLVDPQTLHDAIVAYGYWVVLVVVGLESAGLPLPGEATLVSAAIYAGSTGRLSIFWIIAAAATGAIIGDNIGYWIGRELGLPLLRRYGGRVGLDAAKLRLAQYLFDRHGGKIVFFGRFVAVLRVLAALLAGANRYAWDRFLAFNAAGGLCWAGLFGMGAYLFGRAVERVAGPIAILAGCAALVGVVVMVRFIRRHEARLQAEADRALGGS